jgi:hypothetical protein
MEQNNEQERTEWLSVYTYLFQLGSIQEMSVCLSNRGIIVLIQNCYSDRHPHLAYWAPSVDGAGHVNTQFWPRAQSSSFIGPGISVQVLSAL